ncbi:PHP domain-containing protein [Treponema sp. OMZ 792]|uniref:PHP domain-containing protein n=1 Tax=unclassified Treponema TaxID=2638727 RepID=UPI0020A2F930|nr:MULTISPECIES: PHP domain-containing protein [unclassified Treponema]UTC74571.1 PHP domain-containing protein [Treponema sp. OMZ 792]UTC80967.1 PHP domain-containing protein [Treponema sp. OMZ 798]
MVDLHTHSTASDGTLSPTELAAAVKKAGISAFALTDHDILSGLDEAAAEAAKQGIIFIRGVEISVKWSPGELHLLGLDLRKNSHELNMLLQDLQDERINRNQRMAEKLKKAGFDISYEKVRDFAGGDKGLGRPHFAAYMAAHKMVKKNQEAFDKYFAKGRPFFEEKENAGLAEAISAVKSAGGIPVLAHPMSLYLSWSSLPDVIADFKKQGLVGLEAWNSSTKYNDCKRLEKLASSLDMPVTAGSDFHGSIRKDRKLGETSKNNIKIENRFYENLRALHPDLPPLPMAK